MFGFGKVVTLKKMKDNEFLKAQVHVFDNTSTKEQVITTGNS